MCDFFLVYFGWARSFFFPFLFLHFIRMSWEKIIQHQRDTHTRKHARGMETAECPIFFVPRYDFCFVALDFFLIFVRNHCVLLYAMFTYIVIRVSCRCRCCCLHVRSFASSFFLCLIYCFLILSLKLFLCTFDLDSVEAILRVEGPR